MSSKYKHPKWAVGGTEFDLFQDAADFAREALIGLHYDDEILIYEWEAEFGYPDRGFWSPSKTVARNKKGVPVVKRNPKRQSEATRT